MPSLRSCSRSASVSFLRAGLGPGVGGLDAGEEDLERGWEGFTKLRSMGAGPEEDLMAGVNDDLPPLAALKSS